MTRHGPKTYYDVRVLNGCFAPVSAQILDALDATYCRNERDIPPTKDFLGQLVQSAGAESDHFAQIDATFSKLLSITLELHPSLAGNGLRSVSGRDRISGGLGILSRIPATPQKLFPLPFNTAQLREDGKTIWDGIRDASWNAKYLVPETAAECQESKNDNDPIAMLRRLQNSHTYWEHLYVTTYVDTNTLVIANLISSTATAADIKLANILKRYIVTLAEYMEIFDDWASRIHLCHGSTDPAIASMLDGLPDEFLTFDDNHHQARAITAIFLWTAWQRSLMLFFYYVVGVQIHHGFTTEWSQLLAIRGSSKLALLQIETVRPAGIEYICNWAFELLRSSRSSLGLDFRHVFSRFNDQFQDRNGRCIDGSSETCRGDGPDSCHRFTGADTKAQSMHRPPCRGGCSKIAWDEDSYRDGPAPRAVLAVQNSELLQYCQADNQTLAISHVWAHGEGGRPEDGINICLHARYCDLANKLGCRSYWIDSTCIPSQHPLRGEAIGYINQIFTESKATLVSDQDIQSIDVTNESIATLETLLSILLVCDWNLRAWTMLEAIRGSRSIYLLGRDERPLSLVSLLKEVHARGAVDLVVLLASVQHLLPRAVPGSLARVEESGYLLSQRHASRDGDEVIIWSLLALGTGNKDPVSLWTSQKDVATAFLISNCPRINHKRGFSWAPSMPYVRPERRSVLLPPSDDDDSANSSEKSAILQHFRVRYSPYDGQGSLTARILHDPKRLEKSGLLGWWRVLDMNIDLLSACREEHESELKTSIQLQDLPGINVDSWPDSTHLNPHLRSDTAVFACPDLVLAFQRIEALLKERAVCLLTPFDADGESEYEGARMRGELFGRLVAICSSENAGCTWRWEGVHEWVYFREDLWAKREIFLQ